MSMNSNLISLAPINGTEFAQNRGTKIIFEMNGADLAFIKGRSSYLSIDVLNTNTNQRFTPNMMAGGSALINRIDCYSLHNGQILDTCENYNQWVAIENSYLYDDVSNLQSLEGCGHTIKAHTVINGVVVPTKPRADKVEDNQLSQITTGSEAVFGYKRYVLPLRLPLWRWFDDERLCPNLFLGGVRMEIFLEDPKIAFQNLQAVSINNQLPTGANTVIADPVAGLAMCPYDNTEVIASVDATNLGIALIGEWNNINDVPFTSGQGITLSGGGVSEGLIVSQVAFQNNQFTEPVADIVDLAASSSTLEIPGDITGTVWGTNAVADLPSVIFLVQYTDAAGDVKKRYLRPDTITYDNPNSSIVLHTGGEDLPICTAITLTRPKCVFVGITTTASAFNANFENGLVKMRVDSRTARIKPLLKVMSMAVPPGLENLSSGMNYQFTAWDTFINTLPSSSRKHQQDINSVASKAVAINSHYHDNAKTQDSAVSSYFNGSTPTDLNLNQVQYFINNKLYPVQGYNPQPKEEKVVNENENVKALSTINKEPKNLGNTTGRDLEHYTNPYIHSRELAREDFVYNLRDAEPQIRTEYSADRGTVNTTIESFVWSKKIINISETGLNVVL